MHRVRRGFRFAGLVLAALSCALPSPSSAQRQLRPNPAVLASVSPELLARLRADPFTYFRFINRAWTERVCEAFADVPSPTIVRLHGDAHVEQFALTKDAWGLDDFDDSTRGPAFIDVVRFLGSLDLASPSAWLDRAHRDRALGPLLRGLPSRIDQSGLSGRATPTSSVELQRQAPVTRAAYLAWGERQMHPMDEARSRRSSSGMEALERLVRDERPDLAPGYFAVRRAGWLRMGVGSATIRKVLIRVQGATTDPG